MKTLFSLALGLVLSASVLTASFGCGDEAACKGKKTSQKECCKGKTASKCAAGSKAEKTSTTKSEAKK